MPTICATIAKVSSSAGAAHGAYCCFDVKSYYSLVQASHVPLRLHFVKVLKCYIAINRYLCPTKHTSMQSCSRQHLYLLAILLAIIPCRAILAADSGQAITLTCKVVNGKSYEVKGLNT